MLKVRTDIEKCTHSIDENQVVIVKDKIEKDVKSERESESEL